MRLKALRPFIGLSLAAALGIGAAGCRPKAEGVVHVVVIGDSPRLVDPKDGPLTAGEKVMVNSVAQGLVRFDARGQIVPGLAETWNVSDDGLSYIFRLAMGNWPDGRKITAEQVARTLRRLVSSSSREQFSDALGAVEDVVAMTDRVIEIRLAQPRPHLLQLLAQPEMGLVYQGQGTGPFEIDRANSDGGTRLERDVASPDEQRTRREQLQLSGADAQSAVRSFVAEHADLVLGGTFATLPFARGSSLPRRTLQFDPAMGLFGLVPARGGGLLASPEVRRLLSEAIDREQFIDSLSVPGLVPRATVLEPGLDNAADPAPPAWMARTGEERRAALKSASERLFAGTAPIIRLSLPDGPGAAILFDRLAKDWGSLGITVERSGRRGPADLILVDEVAAATSAAWYLRHFRCAVAAICDSDVDKMLEAARLTATPAQRTALLTEASRRIDGLQLFIPIAAPIRWSLVSARITGFAGNRFAIHTLTGLEQRLDRTGD